LQKINLK